MGNLFASAPRVGYIGGQRSSRGFSLIEVLVSAFVLALGVIGALGMQMSALQTARQSAFHAEAMHFATEVADQMRASALGGPTPEPDNPYLQIDHTAGQAPERNAMTCYRVTANCDLFEMAAFEVAEWLARVDTALPDARVRICRDDSPWNGATGAFEWDCASAATRSPSVVIKIGWRDAGETMAQARQGAPRIVLPVAMLP